MPQYRRHYQKGGIYFFTVVTHKRLQVFYGVEAADLLRECFKAVMLEYPFKIDAIAVLPDHIHCIWSLPENDYAMHCDYIHYNPVKHGLVKRPEDWIYSSFHRFVENGLYPSNWATEPPAFPEGTGGE